MREVFRKTFRLSGPNALHHVEADETLLTLMKRWEVEIYDFVLNRIVHWFPFRSYCVAVSEDKQRFAALDSTLGVVNIFERPSSGGVSLSLTELFGAEMSEGTVSLIWNCGFLWCVGESKQSRRMRACIWRDGAIVARANRFPTSFESVLTMQRISNDRVLVVARDGPVDDYACTLSLEGHALSFSDSLLQGNFSFACLKERVVRYDGRTLWDASWESAARDDWRCLSRYQIPNTHFKTGVLWPSRGGKPLIARADRVLTLWDGRVERVVGRLNEQECVEAFCDDRIVLISKALKSDTDEVTLRVMIIDEAS